MFNWLRLGKCKYFISYAYQGNKNELGFSNCFVTVSKKIKSNDVLLEIEKAIVESKGVDNVVIINFYKL